MTKIKLLFIITYYRCNIQALIRVGHLKINSKSPFYLPKLFLYIFNADFQTQGP